VETPWCEDGL